MLARSLDIKIETAKKEENQFQVYMYIELCILNFRQKSGKIMKIRK
jgi:hypothetical protein